MTIIPHTIPAPNSLSEIESLVPSTTLESLVQQALATEIDHANVTTSDIESRLANPVNFAKPENLEALQTDLLDYNIRISLVSTLARKAVSAVETLIKTQ